MYNIVCTMVSLVFWIPVLYVPVCILSSSGMTRILRASASQDPFHPSRCFVGAHEALSELPYNSSFAGNFLNTR